MLDSFERFMCLCIWLCTIVTYATQITSDSDELLTGVGRKWFVSKRWLLKLKQQYRVSYKIVLFENLSLTLDCGSGMFSSATQSRYSFLDPKGKILKRLHHCSFLFTYFNLLSTGNRFYQFKKRILVFYWSCNSIWLILTFILCQDTLGHTFMLLHRRWSVLRLPRPLRCSSNLGVWYRSSSFSAFLVLGLLHSFPKIWPVSESCHHSFLTRVQTISAFFAWWLVLISSILTLFASWSLHCVFCPAMWFPVIVVETCGVQLPISSSVY